MEKSDRLLSANDENRPSPKPNNNTRSGRKNQARRSVVEEQDDYDKDDYLSQEELEEEEEESESESESDESTTGNDDDDDESREGESSYARTDISEESDSDEDSEDTYSEYTAATTITTSPALDLVARLVANDTTLTEVSIDEASIRSVGKHAPKVAQHIADGLQKTIYLLQLTFSGNWSTAPSLSLDLEESGTASTTTKQKEESTEILDILLQGLVLNSSIKTLVLENNDHFCRSLALGFGKALARNTRLKYLTLSNCNFVGDGSSLNLLLMGLQHSKSIQGLWIQHCDLVGNTTTTTTTTINGCLLDSVAATLSLMNLKTLQLQDTNISYERVPQSLSFFLLDNVQTTISLTELDLSHNPLGPEGFQLLAQCLHVDDSSATTSTRQRNNKNKKKSHRQQQSSISSTYPQHIQTLTLIDCGLTSPSCVKMLANALIHNTTLTNLNVNQNAFGDKGARQWKSLLAHNHTVTTLSMIGCGITTTKLREISDQLRYNNSFFFKAMGLSSDVSLAMMDSWMAVESFSNEYIVGTFGGGGGVGGGMVGKRR